VGATSSNAFHKPVPVAASMRNPWNQLTVVNMVLAVAAATICLGAPIIPALIGALAAGMLPVTSRHLLARARTARDD
jgi:hypothetical protein